MIKIEFEGKIYDYDETTLMMWLDGVEILDTLTKIHIVTYGTNLSGEVLEGETRL